jgi:tetratricopeptide (TPR) repeat protein
VAAGLTDIIGTNLATLPISVIPPGKAGRYRTADRDPAVLAEELGASLVLDGSVQKYGDRLRVTIKMLRKGSNKLDWTHTYDGRMASILPLQEEILAGLADGLAATGILEAPPGAADRERLLHRPTENEEAFADYTQARAFLERDDISTNITRAMTLFESAFRKDPRFTQALGGLGEAYWSQYRKTRDRTWADRARETARRAVAMDTTASGTRQSLAVVLIGTGHFDEAAAELARIIRDQPRNDKAHSMLGDVHERRGRQAEAEEEYARAIALRPAYWEYHWQLARASIKRGDLAAAAREAERTIELQPDNPLGHQMLGSIRQTEGKPEEAVLSYERSLQLAPTASAYSNIGGTFFDAKDFGRAAGYYRRAIEIDPRLPVYRRNLGDTLLELGERGEAMSAYAMAVTLADSLLAVNANDANTMALKALCLAKMNRGDEALAAITRARRVNATSPNILYKHATILALIGDGPAAIQALEVALDAGLPATIAAGDPDLRSISGTEEFKRLISR